MTNHGPDKISEIFARCGLTFQGRRANDNDQPVTHVPTAEQALRLNSELAGLESTERAEALQRLLGSFYQQSQRDRKTGLLTYEAFLEKIEDAIAKRARGEIKTFSVIMADLRGLKKANDDINRKTGDNLIVGAADCLRGSTRAEIDSCGRGGGESDEILLLLEDVGENAHAAVDARLQKNLSETWVDAHGQDYDVGVDMVFGIVEAKPDQSSEEIVAAADELMRTAKAEAKKADPNHRPGTDDRTTYELRKRPKDQNRHPAPPPVLLAS